MSKESWSARIESSLKKEIQEFTKNSDYTNEDIVNTGFNILKNPQEDTVKTQNNTHINQKLFDRENFDINNFEEIDISNLSKVELQNKLIRISFYKIYDTIFQLQRNGYCYVKSVDITLDNLIFKSIEKDLEQEVSLEEVINDVDKIDKIYQIKRG